MRTNLQNRAVQFRLEDGCLVRTVAEGGGDGRTYTHRCSKDAFETVAHAIDETPAQGDGATLTGLARQEQRPFTQVNVALEFLKERGIVEVRHRRCYPATTCVFEDAMVEFLALQDSGATL